MRVEILTPPNDTLLSSMLYEGYLRLVSECGEDASKDRVKGVLENLGKKDIRFRFVGNDVKWTLGRLSRTYGVSLRSFQDMLTFLANVALGQIDDLTIEVKLHGDAVLVGTKGFTDIQRGYSFQIMKADRYRGISSMESGLFTEDVTTYADLSGLLMFFTGLASSYVTSVAMDHYFLFFDIESLLTNVVRGDIKTWMGIKDGLLGKVKERIEEYGSINEEAITLSVLYDTYLLEALEKGPASYVGYRLVKVRVEGQTYKAYTGMPLRVYRRRVDKDVAKEVEGIIEALSKPASRFVKGGDGEGYSAFKALRYLYLYTTTESPSYLSMMYRELHEAYVKSGQRSTRYLECFLRKPIERF